MDLAFQQKEGNDQFVLKELQKGNERAFNFIFNEYYTSLCRFAFSFVKDHDRSEGLVQEVYIKIWEKRESLSNIDHLLPYLMGMVRNHSIDFLRKEKASSIVYQHISSEEPVNTTEEQVSKNDFEEKLLKSILKLPEKCRIAFELSRFEGLSNKDIAQNMQISVKGVEALIGRSLKMLRIELNEFLPSITNRKQKGAGSVLFSLFLNRLKLQSLLSKQ